MTDVIMPQMGESIAEGTVTKWMKKVGDKVQRDEPLFEISTDKVDAEIPSPAAGVLKEIRVEPGTTVPINTVVGVIAAEGEAVASAPAPRPRARPAADPGRAVRPRGHATVLRPRAAEARARPGRRRHGSARLAPSRRRRPRAGRRPPAEKPRERDDASTSCGRAAPRPSCARSPPSTTWTSARSRAPGSRAA